MSSIRLPVCVALLSLAWGPPAQAELGGSVATMHPATVRPHTLSRPLPATNFTVHEYQSASGTAVREYAAPDGNIFAVAWNGPFMPNLEDLLGKYFDRYRLAVASERAGLGPVMVQRPGLVVHSEGHLRAFSGKAFLPDKLPGDVTAQEIR